ncbi:MAG: DUF3892 domain-containing protein [Anaerolineae bacterium]|nr:DUF3892 domain-containing protein [Anaerolineae bacterium]MCI0609520.1 DUF3892 domain-containing protein [Anaerolineae bacterium]
MVTRVEISCINKSDRFNPHERILNVGGVTAGGTPWKLSQTDAIHYIVKDTYLFYVNQGGNKVNVVIATSQYGYKYLKTTADGEQPDNLLSLPECP